MISRHFKPNFKYMRVLKSFQILVMFSIFFLAPVVTQAQTDKKADELKKLETNVATAKAKVALNERQLNVADSLITSGNQLIAESKTETKAIEADRKKLDKDNATKQKSLSKLTTSKDKDEASKARVDLKALDVQYRSDSKALSIRLKDATKMMSTGNANLTKGKATKKNAQDALKISRATLKTAQAKYDAASASGDNTITKDKKKK
jgi:septal ring factor EnvC (AmiA/AmiB activator)